MTHATSIGDRTDITTLSPADHLRALTRVLLSPVVKGPIVRRPRAVNLAERLDADAAGVSEMQRLRSRYGRGPVQLRLPGRRFALLLDPSDVNRVLQESPEPFSLASLEKRGALNHFQPAGVLVSSPEQRLIRRPFNEQVLETGRTIHSHAETMTAAIREEVAALLGHADFTGTLDWDAFSVMWWRMVRRIVLGSAARQDDEITDDLHRLRQRGNLSYLMPQDRARRDRFLGRLQEYVRQAEPGSLAAMVAHTPAPEGTVPHQQIPQWLFAFDALSWATFRALSLAAAQPTVSEAARAEMPHAPDLPRLRATVLESLRLWPTTPLILRDCTEPTRWRNGVLPAGASVVVFAPFFHRDDENVPEAHRFSPELWLRDRGEDHWPLVPFSAGPGICPGRNVVLMTSSMVLGELLSRRDVVAHQRLDPENLPGTLSPFSSRFSVRPA